MDNQLSPDAVKVLFEARTHLSTKHDISFDVSDIDAAIKLKTIAQELNDNLLKGYYATFIREVQNNIDQDPLADIA